MKDTSQHYIQGGAFLIQEASAENSFTPEDFTEEHRMLRDSLRDFLKEKVESRQEVFDTKEGYTLAPPLLEEMGELGFLGIGVPEEYGGYEADFKTQLVFGEIAYSAWSFGLSIGVQTSLGVAPLLLYGSEAQKENYLPGIVSAEIKSCYCLTEPEAGSDANSGKTRAVYSKDGKHFLLNGQKMWITSAGHADLFFVFAKIENDKNLSCLIVEKDFGGIRLGAEEEKMGIRGSSTRQVFFEDVKVPVENLLGERNGGFKIALNVLNTGRIKMATSVTGNAKRALRLGIQYAKERHQFGRPIAQFGAIQHKIGESAARIYAMESIVYRIGGQIDEARRAFLEEGMDKLEAKVKSIAAFAMECAMAKVHNTEAEGFVIDEMLQIHGGMGYSAETKIETLYRNARINRIYEGTNEINRLLSVDMMVRHVLKGTVALMKPAVALIREVQSGQPAIGIPGKGWLAENKHALANLKKAVLLVAGTMAQRLSNRLKEEQEIVLQLADMLLLLYTFESALLRTERHQEKEDFALRQDLTTLLLHHAADGIRRAGKEAAMAMTEGRETGKYLKALDTWAQVPAANLKEARRRIAVAALDYGAYLFSDET